jgi:tRNA(fMet)-specific endonuclease VapC
LSAIAREPGAIAAVTASELLHGVHRLKGARRARTEVMVERLLARLPAVPSCVFA